MIDTIIKSILSRMDRGDNRIFFVETGTDQAGTVAQVAVWFSAMDTRFGRITGFKSIRGGGPWYTEPLQFPQLVDVQDARLKIMTIDNFPPAFQNVRKRFPDNPNIIPVLNSSPTQLEKMIAEGQLDGCERLFYLDAHWEDYWPLRDELAQVIELKRFVAVIDDCFVPGKSDPRDARSGFGYDVYNGRKLEWNYIRDLFEGVDFDYRLYYPERPASAERGYLLLLAGYSREEEARLVEGLPLFPMAADDPLHLQFSDIIPNPLGDFKSLVRSLLPLAFVRGTLQFILRLLPSR
ncbi:MAG: hypothetical protein HQL82_03045 [Magnetococcales bacterium]|nr:hypothetical protein [Magnetococcales bacterium]